LKISLNNFDLINFYIIYMNNIHVQIVAKATVVTALSYAAKYFKVAEKIQVNHLESAAASLVSNAALSAYNDESFSSYKPYAKALVSSGLQYVAENVLNEKFADKQIVKDAVVPFAVELLSGYGFYALEEYTKAPADSATATAPAAAPVVAPAAAPATAPAAVAVDVAGGAAIETSNA
jgi:hypothetical protein